MSKTENVQELDGTSPQQSPEFTKALTFVLNYRDSEDFDGFVPTATQLAKMLLAYAHQPAQGEGMNDVRRVRIMRNALDTIQSEASEPIIRVYAQSALDETVELAAEKPIPNAACKEHNWYGLHEEKCPICASTTPPAAGGEREIDGHIDFSKEI